MKKLTKLSLDQLANELPVLTEKEQSFYFGGGDGSFNSPFTTQEWKRMCDSDTWYGGWVIVEGQHEPTYFDAGDTSSSYGGGLLSSYSTDYQNVCEEAYQAGFKQGYAAAMSGQPFDDLFVGFSIITSTQITEYERAMNAGLKDGYRIGRQKRKEESGSTSQNMYDNGFNDPVYDDFYDYDGDYA